MNAVEIEEAVSQLAEAPFDPVESVGDSHNKTDLTRCVEDILLACEHYFPAAIADMYDPNRMDSEFPLVRQARDRNDEILERIYIGRRFT